MTGLQIAPGVTLPIDYVTGTAAILAQRRKGKTYTGAVVAEELYGVGLPWAALDPTGAWWGLRSSADGKHPGLPVVVIGGQHADLPLEREAGAFIADLVLDHLGWYVIDLSLLDSRAAEREFATAFGERLLRRKMQAGMDFPFHLFIDEADMFLPQEKETKGDVALLAAYSGIVRRGGLHGLGSTLISQRPALINKNALTQLDLLVLLRLVAGNDQDAVRKNYVSRFMEKAEADELMASLASLPVGEGWFLEPGADPPRRVRARVRERRTFNSSATPKAGERRVEPSVFAEVDLDELRESMSAAIERVKAEDPAELQKALATANAKLTAALRDLAARPTREEGEEMRREISRLHAMLESRPPETIEVPVVLDGDLTRLAELVAEFGKWLDIADELPGALRTASAPLTVALERAVSAPKPAPAVPPRLSSTTQRPAARPASDDPPASRQRSAPAAAPDPGVSGGGSLKKAERALLNVLALFPQGRTKRQLATLSGYPAKGSTYRSAIGALRSLGYATPGGVDLIRITDAGVAAAGDVPQLPTGRELLEHWLGELGLAERVLLQVLYDDHRRGLTKDELGERSGYPPAGSTYRSAIGKLRNLELAEGFDEIRASDVFFEGS